MRAILPLKKKNSGFIIVKLSTYMLNNIQLQEEADPNFHGVIYI